MCVFSVCCFSLHPQLQQTQEAATSHLFLYQRKHQHKTLSVFFRTPCTRALFPSRLLYVCLSTARFVVKVDVITGGGSGGKVVQLCVVAGGQRVWARARAALARSQTCVYMAGCASAGVCRHSPARRGKKWGLGVVHFCPGARTTAVVMAGEAGGEEAAIIGLPPPPSPRTSQQTQLLVLAKHFLKQRRARLHNSRKAKAGSST